jgi:hypothetical protein
MESDKKALASPRWLSSLRPSWIRSIPAATGGPEAAFMFETPPDALVDDRAEG